MERSIFLSNLSLIKPPNGAPTKIGSASSPRAILVSNGDPVISYASHPTTTCWSQNPLLKRAVVSHKNL